jgi:hypothetical protein
VAATTADEAAGAGTGKAMPTINNNNENTKNCQSQIEMRQQIILQKTKTTVHNTKSKGKRYFTEHES